MLPDVLPLSSMVPPKTDRALFVGMTGSGKTTLARLLLEFRKYVVVADYKGKIDWPGYVRYTTLRALVRAKEERLVYRPTFAESVDDETRARFWEWVYRRGNTTIYNDETAATIDRNNLPFFMGACLTRGRELGIELWSGTQRPKDIPQVILSESENVYAFRLRLPQDRERVEALTGIPRQLISSLPKHQFLFARQDDDIVGPLRMRLTVAA